MRNGIDYASPGPLTDLASVSPLVLESVSGAPPDICRRLHALVIQPRDAEPLGLPGERFAENQVRPAASLIEALLTLDPAPLDVARAPDKRVSGTAATVCAGDDSRAVAELYGLGEFTVPAGLIA